MPQILLTGQLIEKPTYRVWCLYSSFVHVHNPPAGGSREKGRLELWSGTGRDTERSPFFLVLQTPSKRLRHCSLVITEWCKGCCRKWKACQEFLSLHMEESCFFINVNLIEEQTDTSRWKCIYLFTRTFTRGGRISLVCEALLGVSSCTIQYEGLGLLHSTTCNGDI